MPPTVFHIPVCPFSQRLEVLLALKGLDDVVRFSVVDITRPREPELLARTRGSTALPVLETEDGKIIQESMVILEYLEARHPEPAVARRDPYERAVENMLCALCPELVATGYQLVMNQDLARRDALHARMLAAYAAVDALLREHSPRGPYLFDSFGWAETVFTPMFMRFWFLEYYEGFELPAGDDFARVRRWREACLAHPCARQVEREEIVKLYYDYAKGAGNGALVAGRTCSSFVFEPHWSQRPWPPADKYAISATDAELGLLR
jgi:glutathione S-transferase